ETESGRGIMEEPELTLISSNDVSVAESDTEHTNQEKIKDKINNPACVDQSEFNLFTEEQEFSTLVPDTGCSMLIRPDTTSTAQSASASASPFPSHQTAAMLLELPATSGSLQENFLKRKKNFIQKSLKRVEGVKNRERENNKPEARQFQRGKSETSEGQKKGFLIPEGKKGAVANQLTKVEVSCPEVRKSGGTEEHQHTSRACNQHAEVKIRKEQQTKQETYARNREKAKEFQKKMLDKLRAKKNWK
ncbi:CE295 protein, partial [Eubucco bourcierii]|nr:CE295 protein [Eubucco bourcierii]